MFFITSIVFLLSIFSLSYAETPCEATLGKISSISKEQLAQMCTKTAQLPSCVSQVKNIPIFHLDIAGHSQNPKKILVFSMVHGDEAPAGELAIYWMQRLLKIDGRNNWRVIPLLNPDGFEAKTRNNGRGVDINRNLPTKGWEKEARERWVGLEKSNPRRFPGESAASETETKCILDQLEEFQPDFIISVHTPYGLLDFDGPGNISYALKSFKDMPWKRLGHYPGSLGRYMWAERNVPVLTIELKGINPRLSKLEIDKLQDSLGTFAIRLLTQYNKQSMISSAK